MERLPLEIRERICSFVDAAYQPSARSFALTSKSCCEAATCLFKEIRISASEPEQLDQLLERCRRILHQRQAFKHVRRVEIAMANDYNPDICSLRDRPRRSEPGDWLAHSSRGKLQALDSVLVQHIPLIALLSGLSSFRYEGRAPFPTPLLRHLRDRRNVKLEIEPMFLRSDSIFPASSSAEAYEYEDEELAQDIELLSSPCLSKVALGQDSGSSHGSTELARDVFRRKVSLLCPDIEALSVFVWTEDEDGRRKRAAQSERLSKARSTPNNSAQKKESKVSRLTYTTSKSAEQSLEQWASILDFSTVQDLHISCPSVLATCVDWLKSRRPFPALKKLHLKLPVEHFADIRPSLALIKSVPPLQSLTLNGGQMQEAFRRAIHYHGRTLEELHLFSPSKGTWMPNDRPRNDVWVLQLDPLRVLCPHLRNMSLMIGRDCGNLQENSVYQTLGSFPQLEEIHITLDVGELYTWLDHDDDPEETGDQIASNDDGDDEDTFWSRQFRGPGGVLPGALNLDIRNHLVDCAVDATLAESIFRKISNAKPPGAKPLSRLRLRVAGAGKLGQDEEIYSLEMVTEHLARSWEVIPHPNIDRVGELLVKEIDPPENNAHSKVHSRMARKLPKLLAPIFRRLWPEDESIGDWRKEWHSMPLAGNEV